MLTGYPEPEDAHVKPWRLGFVLPGGSFSKRAVRAFEQYELLLGFVGALTFLQ